MALFTDEQLTSMRQLLGVTDESATGEQILAAFDEALTERADPPTDPAVPEDMALISTVALADLQAAAAVAPRLVEQQHAHEREQVLHAYRDRYPSPSRAAWEKQYDIDPAATQAYLASAPVIVPLAEIGHAGDAGTLDGSDALEAELRALGYGSLVPTRKER
ncbi:MAG: hypothetical protein M3P96_05440 [Actinomycetota bacterium]|nr:hypothetical protein [Actinomycetota bacterium]